MDKSIVLADKLADKLIVGERNAKEVLEVLEKNENILDLCVNRWLETLKFEALIILREAKRQMIREDLEHIYNDL